MTIEVALILLIINVIAFVIIFRCTSGMSPCRILICFATGNYICFFYSKLLMIDSSIFGVINVSEDISYSVVITHSIIVLMSLCISQIKIDKTTKGWNLKVNNITKYTNLMVKINCFVGALIVALLLGDLNWDVFFEYHSYLSLNNHKTIGIDFYLNKLLFGVLPLIGAISFSFVNYLISIRNYTSAALCLPICIMALFCAFAAGSRYFVLILIFGIIGVLFKQNKGNKSIKIFVIIFYTITSVIIYAVIMSVRYNNPGGVGRFGVNPGIEILNSFSFIEERDLSFYIFNFFGGYSLLDATTTHQDYYYPLQYKLLSFSPLPSFIDGFANIRHFEQRINYHMPFSSLSEVIAFGYKFYILFLVILAVTTYKMESFYIKYNEIAKPFVLPLIYVYGAMFIYQLRNINRWMLISLVTVILIEIMITYKNRKI